MVDEKLHKGRYLLLYGSQTGQAQAIAEGIYEQSSKHGLHPELFCLSMSEKKFNIEKEPCVVIVTSSTGDGDPPDTAVRFVRRLHKKTLSSDFLAKVNYTVLGLGDSNYSNFNGNAIKVDKRLSQLGAQRFYPSAFADEVDGLETTVDPWTEGLFTALQKFLGIDAQSVCTAHDEDAAAKPLCGGTQNPPTADHSSLTTKENHKSNISDVTNSSSVSDTSLSNSQTLQSESKENDPVEASRKLQSVRTMNDSAVNPDIKRNNFDISDSVGDVDQLWTVETRSKVGYSSVDRIDGLIIRTNDASENTQSISDNVSKLCSNLSKELVVDLKNSVQIHVDGKERDLLQINSVITGAPSLRLSTLPLSESTLTLPAATPAFLKVTCLSPDEDLPKKLAELPWQNDCKGPSAASDIVQAKVVSAQQLTTGDALRKTLLLKLDLKNSGFIYQPGDSISLICANYDAEVDQLLMRLDLMPVADLPVQLSVMADTKKRRAVVPPHIPEEGASLRYILKNCIDIREPPKKALLRMLVDFTSDSSEKRRLQELCSKEGAEDYFAFIRAENVSLLDVLYTFMSSQPPIERLIEHLPRLQPRPYSACSCENWQPGRVDIAFNVVNIPCSQSRLYARRGLCTGWLDEATQALQNAGNGEDAGRNVADMDTKTASLNDIEVSIFARTNQHFRPPKDVSVPLIMIGPGTGVAPFIGFLQERQLRLEKERDSDVGDTWLFFGCRHEKSDFLFKSTIEEFQQKGVLTKFLSAFSRDCDESSDRPRYVQDNILAHSSEIFSLINEQQGVVFVCGDAKNMAKDVGAAFEQIVMQEQGVSADEAKTYVMKMRIHHQYLEDVWT